MNWEIQRYSGKPLRAGEVARKQGIHLGFETQGSRHHKSKTEVSVAPKRDLGPPNLKKKCLHSIIYIHFNMRWVIGEIVSLNDHSYVFFHSRFERFFEFMSDFSSRLKF